MFSSVLHCVIKHYKDRKCAVNENLSVRIESAGSKTSNKHPLKKRKCRFEFLVWKFVHFYEGDHAFKTIWRLPCLCHLVKIKGFFFQPGRPVFIIVINTSCSGVCLTALWHYLKFLPGVYRVTNTLTIGIYYYMNICQHFRQRAHSHNLLYFENAY